VLHLRVTCPAEATDAVLDSLRNNSGAVHLTVMRALACLIAAAGALLGE
jgi:hypothetical protein